MTEIRMTDDTGAKMRILGGGAGKSLDCVLFGFGVPAPMLAFKNRETEIVKIAQLPHQQNGDGDGDNFLISYVKD